jgi:hypothetical protein
LQNEAYLTPKSRRITKLLLDFNNINFDATDKLIRLCRRETGESDLRWLCHLVGHVTSDQLSPTCRRRWYTRTDLMRIELKINRRMPRVDVVTVDFAWMRNRNEQSNMHCATDAKCTRTVCQNQWPTRRFDWLQPFSLCLIRLALVGESVSVASRRATRRLRDGFLHLLAQVYHFGR